MKLLSFKIILVFKGLPIIDRSLKSQAFTARVGFDKSTLWGIIKRGIMSYCIQNVRMFFNIDCQERASAATSYSAMSLLVSILLKFPTEIFGSSDLTTLSQVFLRVIASEPCSSFPIMILVLQRSLSLREDRVIWRSEASEWEGIALEPYFNKSCFLRYSFMMLS
jgi:hypothetical protein